MVQGTRAGIFNRQGRKMKSFFEVVRRWVFAPKSDDPGHSPSFLPAHSEILSDEKEGIFPLDGWTMTNIMIQTWKTAAVGGSRTFPDGWLSSDLRLERWTMERIEDGGIADDQTSYGDDGMKMSHVLIHIL